MNNAEYWKNRFLQLENATHEQSIEKIKEIEAIYFSASKSLEREITGWYQRFADNNGITMQEARKWLTLAELDELKWDVNQYIAYGKENAINGAWVKELENASAKVHISRLEALKIKLQNTIETLYGKQDEKTFGLLSDIYKDNYYKSIFELQKKAGIGVDFTTLDTKQISNVLSKPWAPDKYNFSERIWIDKNKMLGTIHKEMSQMFMRGAAPDKAISNISKDLKETIKANPNEAVDNIKKKLKQSNFNAKRLVLTESAYFASEGKKKSFEELGVENYELVATLDLKTSQICRSLDGKVYPVSEFESGVTASPFHPFCRTTEAPAIEDDELEENMTRVARDVDGKNYDVPSNMKYDEWHREHVEKDPTYAYKEKVYKNRYADKKQYEKYKEVLGEKAPEALEKFQDLKYNNSKEWQFVKDDYYAQIKGNFLQEKLNYILPNKEKGFVPNKTIFKHTKVLFKGDEIRDVGFYAKTYGGKIDDWRKKAAKIDSEKYMFDIHWYERDKIQYDMKVKVRKEKNNL